MKCCADSAVGCVRLVTIVIATGGLPDRVLVARCAEEDRVLLTKDRRLAMIARGATPVVLVPEDGIDEAARALRIALEIDWQYAPLTRCIIDNRRLRRHRPLRRSGYRKGHEQRAARCGCAPNVVAFIGREDTSAGCSSGSPPGYR